MVAGPPIACYSELSSAAEGFGIPDLPALYWPAISINAGEPRDFPSPAVCLFGKLEHGRPFLIDMLSLPLLSVSLLATFVP